MANANPSAYQQQTAAPARKVTAGGIAGALSVILVWVVNEFDILPGGKHISGEIASAITTIFSFIVSYIVPPSSDDQVVPRRDT